jgi:hypothetical protein
MPRSISGGGLGLPIKCQVCFLRVNNAMHRWPVVVAAHVVVKSGVALVAVLLECTGCTCMVVTTWMKSVGPTIAAYAP